jgi:hypothetical protein
MDDRIDWLLLAAHRLADLAALRGPDPEAAAAAARALHAGIREAQRTLPRPDFAGDRV